MEITPGNRAREPLAAVRIALAAFVLAWVFDVFALRQAVPIWLPFVMALALEVHFFVGASRVGRTTPPDRGPQPVDRERYGSPGEPDELLLVREGGEELWVPYSGEAPDELEELIESARAREQAEQERGPIVVDVGTARARPVRRLLAGLAVTGALAGVVWVTGGSGWDGLGADTRAQAAHRFSQEASRIAGHPVLIRCDEAGDYVGAVQHADGVAAVGGGLAYLTPERCYDLYRLAFEGEVSFSQTARAIAVLAHEAWHLRGVRDEATTECYALQSGVGIGRRLGLSERTARRMMRQQLVENELRAGSSLEYVVPPECRDGGRLDLNPRSSEFP